MLEALNLLTDKPRLNRITECTLPLNKSLDDIFIGAYSFVKSLCVIDENPMFIK